MNPRKLVWILLLSMACKGNGPSAPGTPPGQVESLSGQWTGTVTFADAACGSDAVSVMIGQFDNYVSIPMKTRCYGSIAFQGRISGNQLSGTLNHRCSEGNEYVPATGVDAPASGSASTSHIQLTTTATSSGSGCALPNATIELSR